MAYAQRNLVLRYLRHVAGASGAGDVTDADLLARFLASRDEAAFELLLWRHGTMVLRVCRDVTRDEHAAEDAFQATFLALVRKAATIRTRESVGGWLSRVAYRVALRARAKSRQTINIDLLALPAVAELPDEASLRELRPLLHEEVQRLPAKYRAPIVLCYLEGLTHEEAARRLGWPKGTVAGRMARARELLRKRLTRRGVAPSAALAALSLAPGTASALVPAALVQTTLRAGMLLAAGQTTAGIVSAPVLALTEGVMQTMFWHKVKLTAAVVLALGLLGGVGLFAGGQLTGQPDAVVKSDEDDAPKLTQGSGKFTADDATAHRKARQQSLENLKQIALAMHNYHDTHGYFPPAASSDKNGKPLLSWRVLLLPFLDQNNLYKQFHLDEAWDSPHNKKLADMVLKVYTIPGQKERGKTYYQVFVGPSTMFEHRGGAAVKRGFGSRAAANLPADSGAGAPSSTGGGAAGSAPVPGGAGGVGESAQPGGGPPVGGAVAVGVRMTDILDGTSNTIMVIEGGSAVPWTKPEDLPFTPPNMVAAKPTIKIPPLGGAFKDVIHAAFADGSVATIKRNFDKTAMAAAITRDGGEVYDRASLTGPLPTAGPNELKEENQQLQQEVEQARAEVEELTQQLEKAKLDLQRRAEEEAVGEQLRREQQKLREQLEQLRDEAQRLRQDIERLRGEQKKTPTRKR